MRPTFFVRGVKKIEEKKFKSKPIWKSKKFSERNCNEESIFWHKGEGMSRRSHNINAVKDLILKGLSYQEIWNIAGLYFTSKKFDEYYNFALNSIEAESKSESATDYMKRKEAEKRENRNV